MLAEPESTDGKPKDVEAAHMTKIAAHAVRRSIAALSAANMTTASPEAQVRRIALQRGIAGFDTC